MTENEGLDDAQEDVDTRSLEKRGGGDARPFVVKLNQSPNVPELRFSSLPYPYQSQLLETSRGKQVLDKVFDFNNNDLQTLAFGPQPLPPPSVRMADFVTEHILEVSHLYQTDESQSTNRL